MICDKLARILYGPNVNTPRNLPYRIFADGGASYGMAGLVHLPGTHGFAGPVPDHKPYHGYLGIMVESYAAPVSETDVALCWSLIDIDAEDNPQFTRETLRQGVIESFKSEAVVRASKSGDGLHVIFPVFRNMRYSLPERMPYGQARATAKAHVQDMMVRLLIGGINPCVSGLHNAWLWSEGGKQETLHIPKGFE
jgi:hypothetical protein